MKKLLVIISALVLTLSITACTNTIEKQTNTVTNQEAVTTLPAEEPVVTSEQLTEDTIKSIVYEHAQVKPEEVNHTIIEKDFDDGREEIEVDFWIGKTEYSYTLDLNGNILEYEVERND